MLITKLSKVYCWVCQLKFFKPVNIWQSYKQKRDRLVHFLLLAVCWPGAQNAWDNHAVNVDIDAQRLITTATPGHFHIIYISLLRAASRQQQQGRLSGWEAPCQTRWTPWPHTLMSDQIITNCKWRIQRILRKIIKIVATRCHILKLKCTKFDFGWGSAQDPTGGAYSARSGYKGAYF